MILRRGYSFCRRGELRRGELCFTWKRDRSRNATILIKCSLNDTELVKQMSKSTTLSIGLGLLSHLLLATFSHDPASIQWSCNENFEFYQKPPIPSVSTTLNRPIVRVDSTLKKLPRLRL